MSGYFTTDRARKYGWGVPRLALLTLFAFEVVPRRFLAASAPDAAAAESLALAPYLASMRWLGHAYMGSIGAGVNVQVLGFLGNLAMLLLAAAACVWDVSHDYSILVYLVKTFSGDQLAGKLDTPVETRPPSRSVSSDPPCGLPPAPTPPPRTPLAPTSASCPFSS